VTDLDARFSVLAQDLELGLRNCYTRLGMDDRSPDIFHTFGASVPHDSCNTAWITLSIVQQVTLQTGAGRCAVAPLATYRIDLVRCWPTVDSQGIPSFEDQQRVAFDLERDASALWELAALCSERNLFTIPELGCDAVTFRDMRPTGPLGGFAGWTFPIEINMWGLGTGP
jgi:hypothetical protein